MVTCVNEQLTSTAVVSILASVAFIELSTGTLFLVAAVTQPQKQIRFDCNAGVDLFHWTRFIDKLEHFLE